MMQMLVVFGMGILSILLVGDRVVKAESDCEIETCEVKEIRFIGDGLRGEWSLDGSSILFHKVGEDGFYDVYVADAVGTNENCLTCGKANLPNKHMGSGSWHPSGEYLVFQVQKEDHYMYPGADALAHPGVGYNNDLWIMTAEGSEVWQLTDLATKMSLEDTTPITGLLHAHFSHDGQKLAWSQRLDPGGLWGQWALKVADFVVTQEGPQLENIQTFQPGSQTRYYETNDFSLDDRYLTFCGNLEVGQSETGIDLYLMDLDDFSIERLTHTEEVFDESAHYSPSGNKLIWLSSHLYEAEGTSPFWWNWAKTDLWIRNVEGSVQKQLTFFNTSGTSHNDLTGNKRVIVSYVDWHPMDEGKVLTSLVTYDESGGGSEERLAILELGNKDQCRLGDVNCDGVRNVMDVVALVKMLFGE